MRIACAFACLSALAVGQSSAQPTPDILRGHVRSTDGAPVAGATISAAPSSGPARVTRSDEQGAFSIAFSETDGPFAVTVTMVGYARQTIQVARRTGSTRADIEIRLEPVAQRIAPVTVRAQRQHPQRSDNTGVGPGESGTAAASLSSGLTGDLTGDIASALGTVPGLTITPAADGGLPTISAFGLSGDQNSLTLNGMNFGASGVPRDGLVLRVASSTYDPGRGGFSGVQTSLRLPSGSNFLTQFLHGTAEDPHFQGTPRARRSSAHDTRGKSSAGRGVGRSPRTSSTTTRRFRSDGGPPIFRR